MSDSRERTIRFDVRPAPGYDGPTHVHVTGKYWGIIPPKGGNIVVVIQDAIHCDLPDCEPFEKEVT